MTPAMSLCQEESLGPCTSEIRVSDADEAMRVANSSAYELSASTFGGNTSQVIAMAKKIQSGAVHIIRGLSVTKQPLPTWRIQREWLEFFWQLVRIAGVLANKGDHASQDNYAECQQLKENPVRCSHW